MTKTSCTTLVQTYLARKSEDAKLSWFDEGEPLPGWKVYKAGHFILGTSQGVGRNIFLMPSQVLEDFANVKSEPEGVLRFTRKYGPLQQSNFGWEGPPDEVSEEWQTDRFQMSCQGWLDQQRTLQRYWKLARSNKVALVEALATQLGTPRLFGSSGLSLVSDVRRGLVLRLEAKDLWQALCLILVGFSDRLRKCENESCPASPYFIASRKDQKFCNEMCSRRVANRRWWKEQGQQWRKKRAVKTSKKRR